MALLEHSRVDGVSLVVPDGGEHRDVGEVIQQHLHALAAGEVLVNDTVDFIVFVLQLIIRNQME